MTWTAWLETPDGVVKRENLVECMSLPDGRLVIKNTEGEQLDPFHGEIIRVKRGDNET